MECSVRGGGDSPSRGITPRTLIVVLVIIVLAVPAIQGYTLADVATVLLGWILHGSPGAGLLPGPGRKAREP